MLKILQARLQQYMSHGLPDVQAGVRKAGEPEIKFPTSAGSLKKQENSRKTSTFALLIILKTLAVWITANCGQFSKEMGIPDHFTCLLRNLYAGQEATVGTLYGTTYWFKIEKEVRQSCLLSPCLIFTLSTS